jgi:protein SMG6
MWSLGFHRLLTSLRRSSQTSPRAFELLNDFVYYAYGFYSTLFEDPQLGVFKPMWIEALGDLASYRMAVAVQAMNQSNSPSSPRAPQPPNTLFSKLHLLPTDQPSASTSIQQQVPVPEARIDDSPQPSIGLRAAAELELEIEDEKETWRNKAREWYSLGLNDMPGTGRLHHHLGLLCRDVKGEEVRAVYHFVKRLVRLLSFKREQAVDCHP